MKLTKRYLLELEARVTTDLPVGRIETAAVVIAIEGTTRVVAHAALELVADALAPYALVTCGDCETVTPCECDREQANTFQAALHTSGIVLYAMEEGQE